MPDLPDCSTSRRRSRVWNRDTAWRKSVFATPEMMPPTELASDDLEQVEDCPEYDSKVTLTAELVAQYLKRKSKVPA